jgi:ferritin-like protein
MTRRHDANSSQQGQERNMKHDEQHPAQAATSHSRRSLLGSGAAAATSAMLGLLALACGDDDDTESDSAGKGGSSGKGGSGGKGGSSGKGVAGSSASDAGMTAKPDADIESLNALLGAEYNAITAYGAGAMLIMNAESSDPLYDLRSVIVAIAVDFQSQHKLHAEALVAAIEDLDGTPVEEADVAKLFKPPAELVANPTITNVLKFAAGAERAAAVAYNQVLAGLEDAQLRFLAAAIEGDESQHFIVLAALVLGLAAPGPNLSSERAGDVVPEAFVSSVGEWQGLDKAPPDYFA